MAITHNSTKTLLKSSAALVVCLGLAAGLTPKPAQAGGKGAVLFGAGVVTGIIVNEAINDAHRRNNPPPRTRYYRNDPRPARRVYRTETSHYASREEVREIQEALNTLGYNVGEVDGLPGSKTKRAVRTFQVEIDADPTGYLTRKQKIILLDRAELAESSRPQGQTIATIEREEETRDDVELVRNQQPQADEEVVRTTPSDEDRDENNDRQVTRDWTRVQNALNALGYPAGPENGRLTRRTREAVKAFQIDISHEATGVLTAEEQGILFEDAADLANDDSEADDNQQVVEVDSDPVADEDDDEANVDDADDEDEDEGDKVVLLGSDEKSDDVDRTGSDITNNLVLTEYKAVSSISDPLNQLQAVRDARQNPPAFVGGLSATEKLTRESQLSQLEAEVKKELLSPIIEQAENAPVSVDGVRRIASLEGNAEAIFSVIGADESKPYRSRLQTRQQQILAALVSDQIAELKTYPQSLDGLKKSASWYDRFMQNYADFDDDPIVVDAMKSFESDRTERLTAMFPTFEKDVEDLDNPGSGAPELMADYLSWTGDEKLPISLEYKFVVAQHQ